MPQKSLEMGALIPKAKYTIVIGCILLGMLAGCG